jgi:hypothetical protein
MVLGKIEVPSAISLKLLGHTHTSTYRHLSVVIYHFQILDLDPILCFVENNDYVQIPIFLWIFTIIAALKRLLLGIKG